jgi:hypothetical protein
MSRLRLLFAWLLLAALPLQGFAAATMLFCGTGASASHHDHSMHAHTHAATGERAADAGSEPVDAAHSCGVCASCCHSVAITEFTPFAAFVPLPQVHAAEPFVLIHARAASVPDKPPRA